MGMDAFHVRDVTLAVVLLVVSGCSVVAVAGAPPNPNEDSIPVMSLNWDKETGMSVGPGGGVTVQ